MCVCRWLVLCTKTCLHADMQLYLCLCVMAGQPGTGEQNMCGFWIPDAPDLLSWLVFLLGINHEDLRQTDPTQVIHGAAFMTFHSGTQLGPVT